MLRARASSASVGPSDARRTSSASTAAPDLGELAIRFGRGADVEHAPQHLRPLVGEDVLGDAPLEHQRAIEPARLAAPQNVRRQVEVGVARCEQRRRVPGQPQPRQLHAVGHQHLDVGGQARRRRVRRALGRLALRLPAEVTVDERARVGRIEVARHHQAGVGRAIEAIEERPHVIDGSRLQIFVRPDGRPVVGVVGRVHRLRDGQLGAAVGAVLVRLPALVLHHLELLLQLLGGDHVGQRGQAIRLQPEERLQQVARPDLVIVRPVVAGGAVVVAAPALHDRVERRVGRVARPHEHQVLEQVREAGAPGHLVLRADVVPEVDGHQRAGSIRVKDHPKPVGQCVRFELDFEHRRRDERGHNGTNRCAPRQ